MAEFIDEIVDHNKEEEQAEVTQQAEEQTAEEDDLPEKYRGKSVKDLVQMHQEAEKAIGKKGSEVGELRQLVDSYIQNNLQSSAPKESVQEEEKVDWFADPDKAFEQRINSHPKVQQAEKQAQQYQRETAMQRLKQAHPDMEQIVQDRNFVDWIKGSSVRSELFVRADQQFDVDAANELFSTWKERQNMAQRTVEADKQTRTAQAKQANAGNARGGQAPARKKKYRRADILKLMNDDPDRYMQLADEFLLAFHEGRVI